MEILITFMGPAGSKTSAVTTLNDVKTIEEAANYLYKSDWVKCGDYIFFCKYIVSIIETSESKKRTK